MMNAAIRRGILLSIKMNNLLKKMPVHLSKAVSLSMLLFMNLVGKRMLIYGDLIHMVEMDFQCSLWLCRK